MSCISEGYAFEISVHVVDIATGLPMACVVNTVKDLYAMLLPIPLNEIQKAQINFGVAEVYSSHENKGCLDVQIWGWWEILSTKKKSVKQTTHTAHMHIWWPEHRLLYWLNPFHVPKDRRHWYWDAQHQTDGFNGQQERTGILPPTTHQVQGSGDRHEASRDFTAYLGFRVYAGEMFLSQDTSFNFQS
jgi:hypothetical protein